MKHIYKIYFIVFFLLLLSNNSNQLVNFLLIPIFVSLYVITKIRKRRFYLLFYITCLFSILSFYHLYYYQQHFFIFILGLTFFTIIYKNSLQIIKNKRIKKNYVLAKKNGFLTNINLGSGIKWVQNGWIAIDKCHKMPNDKRVLALDALNGELLKHFGNEAVDSIYTSHTLEHFTLKETRNILNDCYKILKPKRIIRIVVPDLDICIEKYYKKDYKWWKNNRINPKTDTMNKLEMTKYLMRSIGANNDLFNVDREDTGTIRGLHLSTYNFEILNQILLDIGFSEIKQLKYNQCSEIFEGLDNRERCSLYIEAIK